jgi:hypothetical protein
MSRLLSQKTPREKRLKKLTSKLSEGSSSVDLSGNPLTTSDLKVKNKKFLFIHLLTFMLLNITETLQSDL